jgi:hypothetical protein
MAVTTEIKTTGQLRKMLALAAKEVMNGSLPIDRAIALHKIAKNISDSLYSETKIAMFRKEADQHMENFGELPLGDPSEK